ncbi:hypothetical protein [Planctomicrobium piriforme]|uniref:hypothetical protein n=1 Tax=Planctomicrobium piriforme TaxID=1576369 RepID=UPI001113E32A|nr:hypothetical protein [Planctomicrobium piriforme]
MRFTPLLLALASPVWSAEPQRFATGSEFQQLINRPLLANRDLTPLREVLKRFSEERDVALLLDRRIDPRQLVAVDLQASYFDTGIGELVKGFADITTMADAVIIAPQDTAATLQTRLALAEQALDAKLGKDLGRKFELAKRKAVAWDELTVPRQLLESIAKGYSVTIENAEAIPYDLWPAGTLPHPNATEALLIIATQFGLDVEWVDGRHVRLVPAASSPTLKVEHRLRGMTSQRALQRVKERLPDLEVTAGKDTLTVIGRQEEQQEVAVLIGNRAARKAPASPASTALQNRRFTLRMNNRPFLELVQVLEKQGVQVQRDETALQDAGLDLNTRISLDLENATVDQMLGEACRPLGLRYQVDGMTIHLFPAAK